MAGFEVLEHTADIGVRATGPTLESCFEQAAKGLAAIIGIDRPGAGDAVHVEVVANDLGALLVDWLGELLYLHDSRDALISKVQVISITSQRLAGTITLAPRGDEPVEGLQVKAVTYHQLRVEKTANGFVAEVYLDV